ncbi:nuclease-related domain-containing protein [Marinilactibacillus sp. GCM10026970]|uniref:nuclease-related domain-containing protein n=1 Tax=Marinilactibacillus sp. GCM10026970 TaxID=3252642 RepID=UPI00360F360D
MSFFNRLKEPVFLKENSNTQDQLTLLKELEPSLNAEGVKLLRQDIRNLEYGMIGEKSIEYELKNSHMPMYILHDVYLEDGDLSVQIDYLVFTKKLCFVIESKNLYGNIEINHAGDFVRTIEFKGRKKKEGIYSPITQNQRHMDLMKKLRINNRNNFLTKFLTKRNFEEGTKSIVVLSNPKTVLNARYAKKEVKEKVIRADQLVKYITDAHKQSSLPALSDKNLLQWAEFYKTLHKESVKDYTKKYEAYKVNTYHQNIKKVSSQEPIDKSMPKVQRTTPVNNSDLYEELKTYRLNKSREENFKAYTILRISS